MWHTSYNNIVHNRKYCFAALTRTLEACENGANKYTQWMAAKETTTHICEWIRVSRITSHSSECPSCGGRNSSFWLPAIIALTQSVVTVCGGSPKHKYTLDARRSPPTGASLVYVCVLVNYAANLVNLAFKEKRPASVRIIRIVLARIDISFRVFVCVRSSVMRYINKYTSTIRRPYTFEVLIERTRTKEAPTSVQPLTTPFRSSPGLGSSISP